MKKRTVLWLLPLLLLLTACRGTTTNSSSSSSQTSSTSSVSSTMTSQSSTKSSATASTTESTLPTQTSESESQQQTTRWNETKADELRGFMDDWGKEMGQSYQAYSPGNNADLYGLALPDGVLSGVNKWQATIDGTPINIAWSETGVSGADYDLVAVYADTETQDYLSKHVYFFTIHQGGPLVLVTSQNQGNEQNYLYFSETENVALKDGFSKIVDNQ